jgi:predicted GIY-YIG superfamily endonuclease
MLNSYPNQPGVYCFKNIINDKVYIGSTQCLYNRLNQHLKNKDSNQHLQNAIKHYGINSFCITYQVLKTSDQALCLEQMLLDYIFKLKISCYNIASTVGGGKVRVCYKNHKQLSEAGGSSKSKNKYGLNVFQPDTIYSFSSGVEASYFIKVSTGNICYSCKNVKPYNSELGRWLFSDVSIEDLKFKFNNLTQKEIKGHLKYL